MCAPLIDLPFTHYCTRCNQPIWCTIHGIWLTTEMAGSCVCERPASPLEALIGHVPGPLIDPSEWRPEALIDPPHRQKPLQHKGFLDLPFEWP